MREQKIEENLVKFFHIEYNWQWRIIRTGFDVNVIISTKLEPRCDGKYLTHKY